MIVTPWVAHGDSQHYALSGDIRFFAKKLWQMGAVTRKYDAAPRDKRGVTTSKNQTLERFLVDVYRAVCHGCFGKASKQQESGVLNSEGSRKWIYRLKVAEKDKKDLYHGLSGVSPHAQISRSPNCVARTRKQRSACWRAHQLRTRLGQQPSSRELKSQFNVLYSCVKRVKGDRDGAKGYQKIFRVNKIAQD
eukprot:sb/3471052/